MHVCVDEFLRRALALRQTTIVQYDRAQVLYYMYNIVSIGSLIGKFWGSYCVV